MGHTVILVRLTILAIIQRVQHSVSMVTQRKQVSIF